MCGRYVSSNHASIERKFNLVQAERQFPPELHRGAAKNRDPSLIEVV